MGQNSTMGLANWQTGLASPTVYPLMKGMRLATSISIEINEIQRQIFQSRSSNAEISDYNYTTKSKQAKNLPLDLTV